MYDPDTIAAIATPPGPGGIGVVRVSGPLAAAIADRTFRPHRRAAWQTHRLYHGRLVRADGAPIDDGLAVLMRGPHSYTGEDVLELHCHGSPAILRLVLAAVLQCGARPAGRGEFTRRAFLNGKLDLTQAEAVLEVVRARTPEGAIQAVNQLLGGLGSHLDAVRQRLIHVKAHLEMRIDFVDEDPDVAREDGSLAVELGSARDEIDRLLESYARGRLLRDGLRIAIIGRPNAGKSSLLNALLGEDRAIVTPVAGTTRDVIEETADMCGIPVVLSDTAGLRETPDAIERLGVERALAAAQDAELSLLVVDAAAPPEPPIVPVDGETIVVLNKSDLPSAWNEEAVHALLGRCVPVRVSAVQRIGLDHLRQTVAARVAHAGPGTGPPLIGERHRDALQKARECLGAALTSALAAASPELVAVDLQAALDHIGAVTGAVTNEQVLDAIFAEFCVGK